MNLLEEASNGKIRWLIALWAIFLVIFSLQPLRLSAARGGTWTHLILHTLAFGLPAFVLVRLRVSKRALLICSIGLALCIEAAQSIIYRNPFEWQDLGADLFDTALVTMLSIHCRRRR